MDVLFVYFRTGEYAVNIVDLNAGIWDLFFTNIQKQDEGRYFCVATNDFALPKTRTSKYADLQIGGKCKFSSSVLCFYETI